MQDIILDAPHVRMQGAIPLPQALGACGKFPNVIPDETAN